MEEFGHTRRALNHKYVYGILFGQPSSDGLADMHQCARKYVRNLTASPCHLRPTGPHLYLTRLVGSSSNEAMATAASQTSRTYLNEYEGFPTPVDDLIKHALKAPLWVLQVKRN